MALTSVGVKAVTVESYNSLLQDILQQVLPIAQQICKFSKDGPDNGSRLRPRCKLEGLSRLSKSLHRLAMQHRDTKDTGKEACDNLRDLVQTELSKLSELEQHRKSFPIPPRQNDRKTWQEYQEM
jgi:hypothetical protein